MTTSQRRASSRKVSGSHVKSQHEYSGIAGTGEGPVSVRFLAGSESLAERAGSESRCNREVLT